MAKFTVLYSNLLLLSLSSTYVYAQSDDAASSEDACAAEPLENYNLGMRIGSIFIILATSALGTYLPILLHRISPYQQGDIRDWLLTVGKFFGTGVILATAFVHMLPDAMENFTSECLSAGWLSYGAFAGVFCMIASFALQLLEVASVSYINKLKKAKQQDEHMDTEHGKISYDPTLNEKFPGSNTFDHKDSSNNSNICNELSPDHHHMGDNHGHTHGVLLHDEDAYKHIGTYILELGIVMHSVLIGIDLGTTGNSEFTTLLIALVFHQFFEGMALGTRLNEANYKSWVAPICMGLIYIIMTPIGIAIGIGIHASFNGNSYSNILASAILDSLSAGILLYNAYVSLMSMEMSHNPAFHNGSTTRKICSFVSMYVGAGLMSLIGEWA